MTNGKVVESEPISLAHAQRVASKKAREREEKLGHSKVCEEWIDIHRMLNSQGKIIGKVRLLQRTTGGYKHSLYVGKESKSETILYLNECREKGIPIKVVLAER